MTTLDLVRAYLDQASTRLDLIAELRRRGAWSDVVRFAQEAAELALKALLRHAAIEREDAGLVFKTRTGAPRSG